MTATDREHKAQNKYDTFGLEASYLARGQAQRVEDLTEALARLRAMPLRAFGDGEGIQSSALVEVENAEGERDLLFLVGAGGGEEVMRRPMLRCKQARRNLTRAPDAGEQVA